LLQYHSGSHGRENEWCEDIDEDVAFFCSYENQDESIKVGEEA